MKPLFQRVANNGFLQERQNVSNEMPYNHRFYKGVRNFTLVVLESECSSTGSVGHPDDRVPHMEIVRLHTPVKRSLSKSQFYNTENPLFEQVEIEPFFDI